jgi:hypothetical protein
MPWRHVIGDQQVALAASSRRDVLPYKAGDAAHVRARPASWC